jgi:RNA polymerase sigma-70 factor, ECF subfamily
MRSEVDGLEKTPTDRQLIEGCLNGDTQAWADLFFRYRPRLVGLCLSWTRDHALAEDIAHDAIVRAFEQIRKFDLNRRFFPWLAGIARHRLLDIYRGERPCSSLDGEHRNSYSSDTTIQAVIDAEDRAALLRALSRLPASQRAALLLSEVERLSYAEVAESLGATESAVKSLIFRARGMLRRTWRPVGAGVALVRIRTRSRLSDLTNAVASRMNCVPLLIERIGTALAIVLVGLVPLPSFSVAAASVSQPGRLGAVSVVTANEATRIEPSAQLLKLEPVVTKHKNMVQPQISYGQRRPRALAPPSGSIQLDVFAPDGSPLFEHETGFSCDGQGAGLLPKRGPIQATC